jgi:hypothetical protein
LLLAVALLVPLVGTTPLAGPSTGAQRVVPTEFGARVERYIDLHHAVAGLVGFEELCLNPEQLLEQQRGLAAAIREFRQFEVRGNVFTPGVAEFFREHIAAIVREMRIDVAGALADAEAEADEEGFYEATPLEVNGALPWNAGHVMWPSVLWQLPALPPELEYRFVGTTLVLIDVRAGLVVDVLEAAMPVNDGNPPDPTRLRPCDVHPDLPACWS